MHSAREKAIGEQHRRKRRTPGKSQRGRRPPPLNPVELMPMWAWVLAACARSDFPLSSKELTVILVTDDKAILRVTRRLVREGLLEEHVSRKSGRKRTHFRTTRDGFTKLVELRNLTSKFVEGAHGVEHLMEIRNALKEKRDEPCGRLAR